MKTYRTQITEYTHDFTKTYMAGSLVLEIHYRWDMNAQEQWDILDRAILDRRDADPLLNLETGEIIRDYDYLTWYTEWNETVAEIPQSLRNTAEATRLNILAERKEEAKVLKKIYDELTDRLAWYVDVTVNEEVYTGVIRPKGWIMSNDNSWAIQFDTELESVGFDQLDQVAVVAEVA